MPNPGDTYKANVYLGGAIQQAVVTLKELGRDAQGPYWVAKVKGGGWVEVAPVDLRGKVGSGSVPRGGPKAKKKAAKKKAKKKAAKKKVAKKKAPARKKTKKKASRKGIPVITGGPLRGVGVKKPRKKKSGSPGHKLDRDIAARKGKSGWRKETIYVRDRSGGHAAVVDADVLHPARRFAIYHSIGRDKSGFSLGHLLSDAALWTQSEKAKLKKAAEDLDKVKVWHAPIRSESTRESSKPSFNKAARKHGLKQAGVVRDWIQELNPQVPPTGSYRTAQHLSPAQLAGSRSVLSGRRKVYRFHPSGRGGAREFAQKARRFGAVENVGLLEERDPGGRIVPVVYVDLTRSDPTFKSVLTQTACRFGGWDEEPGA